MESGRFYLRHWDKSEVAVPVKQVIRLSPGLIRAYCLVGKKHRQNSRPGFNVQRSAFSKLRLIPYPDGADWYWMFTRRFGDEKKRGVQPIRAFGLYNIHIGAPALLFVPVGAENLCYAHAHSLYPSVSLRLAFASRLTTLFSFTKMDTFHYRVSTCKGQFLEVLKSRRSSNTTRATVGIWGFRSSIPSSHHDSTMWVSLLKY